MAPSSSAHPRGPYTRRTVRPPRKCRHCHRWFVVVRDAKFCSNRHRQAAYRLRRKSPAPQHEPARYGYSPIEEPSTTEASSDKSERQTTGVADDLGFQPEGDREDVSIRYRITLDPVTQGIVDRRLDAVAKQQQRPITPAQRATCEAAARELVRLCDPMCPVKTVWRGKDPKVIAGDVLSNDRWHCDQDRRWRIAPGKLQPSEWLYRIHANATRARFARAGAIHRQSVDDEDGWYANRRVGLWGPVAWRVVEVDGNAGRPKPPVVAPEVAVLRCEAEAARDGVFMVGQQRVVPRPRVAVPTPPRPPVDPAVAAERWVDEYLALYPRMEVNDLWHYYADNLPAPLRDAVERLLFEDAA